MEAAGPLKGTERPLLECVSGPARRRLEGVLECDYRPPGLILWGVLCVHTLNLLSNCSALRCLRSCIALRCPECAKTDWPLVKGSCSFARQPTYSLPC